jgi:hypothetical protein
MGFDIRLPIGMMFLLFGLLVAGYGAATQGDAMYGVHSLGININLWWGLAMIIFASGMLLLARRGALALRSTIALAAEQDRKRHDPK